MGNYDTPGVFYDSGVFYDTILPVPQPTRKKMAKIKLSLNKLSITELLQKANNIKTALTGNASFATPIPALTVLTTAITALGTANNTYESGQVVQKQNLTNRDSAADGLIAVLTQLASYVEAQSGGDPAKIQSAGMDVRATASPSTIPTQVANLFVTAADNDGELDAQWDRADGAKSYEIQSSVDPITPTSWVSRASVTRSRVTLNSFTSGQRIWVRVRAVGAAGQGAWSDPAVKTVP
jgi:hypothetical protein